MDKKTKSEGGIKMQPIIPNWIIYLIEISSSVELMLKIVATLSFLILVLCTIFYAACLYEVAEEEVLYKKFSKKCFKIFFAVFLISSTISMLIPDKEVLYMMLVNSFITPDNLNYIGGEAKDLVDYIFQQINNIVNGVGQ